MAKSSFPLTQRHWTEEAATGAPSGTCNASRIRTFLRASLLFSSVPKRPREAQNLSVQRFPTLPVHRPVAETGKISEEEGNWFSMHLSAGPTENSWQPAMAAKTNTVDYWLNWRVLLCAVWVFFSMAIAAIVIWKYEGPRRGDERAEAEEEAVGTLYDDESWRPCFKEIHPAWLLAFRAIAFLVLSASLIVSVVVQGGQMFYFYTQWTFALVTIYFGIGSLLSVYGCYKFVSKGNDDRPGSTRLDAENGIYVAPANGQGANAHDRTKRYGYREEHYIRPVAGFWGYAFQIIYQTNAGAVMLTDCVFWIIIVPFLAIKDYNLNFFMIGMHSVNAIFLLGDTALNSMTYDILTCYSFLVFKRFPWFRISYFFLWTVVYVIFQWVVHACVSIWWPYPFLDFSSSFAPLWYFSVAVMHFPCYAIFPLIIKTKHLLYSSLFPESYLC
ncbi:hypothetical protein Taro_036784 [Colocasia esculenta]|uniref:Uncharacterized protein n=1 Tax=Colocasia esculenta TaxID=4460 RepID=A0A843W2F9_COLES|nr:hypothetical protein [Colocasia esculenta]